MTDIRSDTTIVQGTERQVKMPKGYTGVASKDTATPNVRDLAVVHTNNSIAKTVTNFIGGIDPQTIRVIPNDPGIAVGANSNTTIANNANIVTNTGANKLLKQGFTYQFTYSGVTGKWHEGMT